jgi:microcystin-dependent protein
MAISSALGTAGAVPVGVVNPFAGATAPSGWLLCFGQAVSRTLYPVLFNTISTSYGVGDGSTTFNVPDLRGRAVAGMDNMGGTAASRLTATVLSAANTLGATGGTQTQTLTSAEMPSHTHTQNAHDHLLYYQGSVGGNRYMVGDYLGGAGASYFIPSMTTVTASAVSGYSIAQGVTATNQNTGGGGAHLNTQPTIVLNYIIKAQ